MITNNSTFKKITLVTVFAILIITAALAYHDFFLHRRECFQEKTTAKNLFTGHIYVYDSICIIPFWYLVVEKTKPPEEVQTVAPISTTESIPEEAPAQPKITCHENDKYFIIAMDHSESVGEKHLIKYKNNVEQKFDCGFEVAEGDYELPDEGDAYFLALKNEFLIIDSGTDNYPRGLDVYDLSKRKKVYSTDYYSPFKVEDNSLDYWSFVAEATPENCPNMTPFDSDQGERAQNLIIGHIILDLNTLEKREIEIEKRECRIWN